MKKKELLKLKTLKPTKELMDTFRADTGEEVWQRRSLYGTRSASRHTKYEWYKFIEARVENNILKVAIWTRKRLMLGWNVPEFTIYIDKENQEWSTYDYYGERWLSGMICNLPYTAQDGEIFGSPVWSSETSNKEASTYLGCEDTIVYSAVKEFQYGISKDRLIRKHNSELEQIDEFMAAVRQYPKGYNNEWLIRKGFRDRATIFYKPGKTVTEGYCTCCGKFVKIRNRPKHMEKGVCPEHKTEVTFRSWGRQNCLQETKLVGIIDKTKNQDEFCLSISSIRLTWRKENNYQNPEISIGESYRFRMDGGFRVREEYEFYEYRHTGVIRWCHMQAHGMGYYRSTQNPYCTLYTGNLKRVRQNTKLKYTPIEDFLEKVNYKQMDIEDLLSIASRYQEIEVLIKTGMSKITLDIMQSCGGMIYEISTGCRKLEDTLKLDKVRMRQAVRLNVTRKELQILQASKWADVTLQDDWVRKLEICFKYKSMDDIVIALKRGNIGKLLNYWEKITEGDEKKLQEIARDYDDYLEQLGRLHIPLTKSNRFPANFYETHRQYAEQIQEMEDKLKKADTRRKNSILKKLVEKQKELYECQDRELMIVWPTTKKDFEVEGQLQHNCVGGYFEKMVNQSTTVFFIRKKESPEIPFCTVEFNKGKLIQCRSRFNATAPDEAIEYCKKIAEHYEKETLKRLSEEEKELDKAAGSKTSRKGVKKAC